MGKYTSFIFKFLAKQKIIYIHLYEQFINNKINSNQFAAEFLTMWKLDRARNQETLKWIKEKQLAKFYGLQDLVKELRQLLPYSGQTIGKTLSMLRGFNTLVEKLTEVYIFCYFDDFVGKYSLLEEGNEYNPLDQEDAYDLSEEGLRDYVKKALTKMKEFYL